MMKHRHPRIVRGRTVVMKFDRMGRRVEYIETVRDDAIGYDPIAGICLYLASVG